MEVFPPEAARTSLVGLVSDVLWLGRSLHFQPLLCFIWWVVHCLSLPHSPSSPPCSGTTCWSSPSTGHWSSPCPLMWRERWVASLREESSTHRLNTEESDLQEQFIVLLWGSGGLFPSSLPGLSIPSHWLPSPLRSREYKPRHRKAQTTAEFSIFAALITQRGKEMVLCQLSCMCT